MSETDAPSNSNVDTNVQLNNNSTDTPVASATTQTDSPASTTGPADTAASGQPQGEGEQPKPSNRDRRAEKRIASLTRKNEELLHRLGRIEGMLEANGRQSQREPEGDGRPQPAQFKTYDEYVDALTDWKVDQKLSAKERQAEQRGRVQTANSKAQERNIALADRLIEAGKDIEGFDEVMEEITADGFPISATMRDYLEESENPAHVAQYLADHPREAMKLYGQNSAAAIRALEKIEAQVAPKSTQQRTTGAPPPVPTVGGRSVVSVSPKDMSMDDYAAHRRAQMNR